MLRIVPIIIGLLLVTNSAEAKRVHQQKNTRPVEKKIMKEENKSMTMMQQPVNQEFGKLHVGKW